MAQGITIGIGVRGAVLIAAGAVVVVHGGLGAGGGALQVRIIHQLLGEVVAQGITIGIGIRGAVLIAAGAVVVVHGRLGAGGSALQVGGICHFLGEVVAQGITALKGLVRAVGIAAGAVVIVHGGLGAGGSALQVGIVHQLLGEVVAQGGLQETIVGVVSLGDIHVAVLVGKILAAVAAVPVGIVAGLGAVGVLSLGLSDVHMVIGVLIRQLVAAGGALRLGYAGGFVAGVGLVGALLGAAAVLADLPVAGGVALIGLALVVMAQGGQQEGSVGGESGGRIQLAVLIGIVVAAVGAVPIGLVAAHLAGGSHSGRLGSASMGQRSDGKVRGIVIEVLVAVLEILVAVGAIAISLVARSAAGGSLVSGGSDLALGVVVGIELAILGMAGGTHSLGDAGGGGVGGVRSPLLLGAAGHLAGAIVLGVVMFPLAPLVIGGMGDGEGPAICREAIGGSEVTVAGDDQVHLVGAGIGGTCHHLAVLLIHQGGLAAAQGQRRVQGDGGGLGMAVPNQVGGSGEGEVRGLGRSLGDDPGEGVALGGGAPLVSILFQLHSHGVGSRVGGLGFAADGVALAGDQEGVLVSVIGDVGHAGAGEDDGLEILGHGHSGGIGGVGNIRCLDADIVGALAAYGGSALGAGGPGLAVGGLGPLHSGVGAGDLAVLGLPDAGSHALKAAGSGGLRLGGGGGEDQGHFLRRGGAGDGDLGEAVTGDGDAVLGQIGRIVLGEVIAVFGGDGHSRNGMGLQNRLLQIAGGDGHVLAPGDGDGAGLGDDVKLILVGSQLHLIALIAGEIVLAGRVAGDVDGADGAVVLQGLLPGGDADGGACGEVGDGGEHSPDGDVVVACSFADLVAGDVHLAGQLDGPVHIRIIGGVGLGYGRAMHAGACTGGGVAGDGGAAEVERADGSYAAADVGVVIADGGVFDDSRMIGISIQIVPDRGVPLLGFIVFSGSDIQAAAAAGGGVAGDGGAVNGEEAVTRVNAAAIGGFVVGDRATVDGDGAARAVHAAAVAVVVGGIGLDSVAGDGTGVHSEGAAGHIDAAAVAAGSRAAGDGTAVHDEGAAGHFDTTAGAVGAGAGGTGGGNELGEAAAPQGEGAAGGYRHALMAVSGGELAGALVGAVGNGGVDIFAYNDTGGVATGFEGVGVAIEAEAAVAHGSPGSTIGIITTIFQQEVVALGQIFQRGNADPLGRLVMFVVAVDRVCFGAADAVGVAGTLVPQLQAGIAGGQQGTGFVGGGAQGIVAAAIREEARRIGGALYGQSGNIVGGDTDMALGGVEAAVHGDIGTGGSGAIQVDVVLHAVCGILLGDDRAAQYGGNVFDILHIDGAALPLGRVAGEGAVGDLCFIAMQRQCAAVASRGVAGEGAAGNGGGAIVVIAVDGAARGIVSCRWGAIVDKLAVFHGEAGSIVMIQVGICIDGTILIALEGAVSHRDSGAIGIQHGAAVIGEGAVQQGHSGAARLVGFGIFFLIDIDEDSLCILDGHAVQRQLGGCGVIGNGNAVVAGEIAGVGAVMLAVGDGKGAVVYDVGGGALMAVQTDVDGGASGNGELAGHEAVLHQVVVAGALDVAEALHGGVGDGAMLMHGQRHFQIVAAALQVYLGDVAGEAGVIRLDALFGIGDDHGAGGGAAQGHGNADAGILGGSLLGHELGVAGEVDIIRKVAVMDGVILDGDGAGAQVHGGLGVHIDTAAAEISFVAGDGAAVEVQRTVHIDTAAEYRVRESTGIIERNLIILDGGLVVHGEDAAVFHIHAAAAGEDILVAAPGLVSVHRGGIVHSEDAIGAHIHAAAVEGSEISSNVAESGVAGDASLLRHGEGAVGHIHAAAVAAGGIAGDLAAGHVEDAAVGDIDSAAVTGGLVAAGDILGDLAAGHVEGAAFYIHGAAIAGVGAITAVFAVLRGIAGDQAVHQVEGAAGEDHYGGAKDVGGGAAVVIDELAAIHIKCTVDDHAACGYIGGIVGGVAGDGAAVHIKGGVLGYGHAGAPAGFVPIILAAEIAAGDLTGIVLAVGEVEGVAAGDHNSSRCSVAASAEGMAVQAEGHARRSRPAIAVFIIGKLCVVHQKVVALGGDKLRTADAGTGDHPMAFGGPVTVGTATDAVLVDLLGLDLQAFFGGSELGIHPVSGEVVAVHIRPRDQEGGNIGAGNTDGAAALQAIVDQSAADGEVDIVSAVHAAVAGDGGDATGGDNILRVSIEVHAAAALRGGVIPNGGACKIHSGGVDIAIVFIGLHEHAAAIGSRGVFLDDAAVEVYIDIAVGVERTAAVNGIIEAGGRAAGDGAAGHGEIGKFFEPGGRAGGVGQLDGAAGLGGAVGNGAALIHVHRAGRTDGSPIVGGVILGDAVLDGGAGLQVKLTGGVFYENKGVAGLDHLAVALEGDILQGQLAALIQVELVKGGIIRPLQGVGFALFAADGDVSCFAVDEQRFGEVDVRRQNDGGVFGIHSGFQLLEGADFRRAVRCPHGGRDQAEGQDQGHEQASYAFFHSSSSLGWVSPNLFSCKF